MNISIRNFQEISEWETGTDGYFLEIGKGLFGLLGPNGAGKIALMRILVTLLKPTEGIVTVNVTDLRRDWKKIRRMIEYLPQDFIVFAQLAGIKE